MTGSHDLVVGSSHFTTRCRNCGYTHFYRFNLEYIGQCPIDEEEVSAPRAP
ncbi:MAG: DNA repair protein RadA [Methanoculleus sp.]|nr:DNA repair protein RadA [Methanoculleus sp.]